MDDLLEDPEKCLLNKPNNNNYFQEELNGNSILKGIKKEIIYLNLKRFLFEFNIWKLINLGAFIKIRIG